MNSDQQYAVCAGSPLRLGAMRHRGGVNFSLNVRGTETVEALLYREGEEEPFQAVAFPEDYRTGQIYAAHVSVPENVSIEYNYRINGVECTDPYARVFRRFQKSDGTEAFRCGLDPEYTPKTEPLGLRYRDCIFYKVHVRGFTNGENAGVRHPGTFTGLREKIPYLKKLGVTSVILMPCYEFDTVPKPPEIRGAGQHPDFDPKEARESAAAKKEKRVNYWGYTGGLYYCPKLTYCATKDPVREFASLVDALHENGLECLTEFYFPEEMPGWQAVNVLHYWRMAFNLDGFHLVGCGDWIHAIVADPILSFSKIVYLSFDENRMHPYAFETPIQNLAQMDRGYQICMRRFLKGDLDASGDARSAMLRNSGKIAQMNFFADHDGMTMMDMVSYNEKHNEANGEENLDGASCDYSWNCGEEGKTRRRNVQHLRERQLRNAFLMLLTSQGSPVIYAGDECGNSQGGNNNAWCQDNPTGWVTWSTRKADKELRSFVQKAIAFRKEHPVLRMPDAVRLSDYKRYGYPDLSFHGRMAWHMDEREMPCGFGAMYCGSYAERPDGSGDDFVYLAYNAYWMEQDFALPDLPRGLRWKIVCETAQRDSFHIPAEDALLGNAKEKKIVVAPRSVTVLTSVMEPAAPKRRSRAKSKQKAGV